MTRRRDSIFDDRIADWLEDDPTVAPTQVLDTVLAALPSIPQRRASAPWARLPFVPATRLGFAGALLVLAALVVFSMIGLALIGQPGPTSHPSPTASPVPSATAIATGSPVPTASAVASTPLPDAMLGGWYHTAPSWMWFLRAGDPFCVQAVRTEVDCAIWQPVGKPREIGVATMQGNVLSVGWLSGFCTRITSTYTVALAGDSLTLTERPGGCQGGDYALTRAGTGSAPTAPPQPTP
jgi:hypothetical protein